VVREELVEAESVSGEESSSGEGVTLKSVLMGAGTSTYLGGTSEDFLDVRVDFVSISREPFPK